MPFHIDTELAETFGLVAVGGDLSPDRLLRAYRNGIFPWFDEGDPVLWWSPDPRAIFELEDFHVSRRLARTIRSNRFHTTVDKDFVGVMRGCAEGRDEGTWITPDMIEAYSKLHQLGHAHSLEVWQEEKLAGGIYGITVGALFAGESMFSRVRDASKVALVKLIEHLRGRSYQLFDIQFLNDHTKRLGAVEIPRNEYLVRLRRALENPEEFI
jgi:leucyl/phenylalanyl-tRNA---protein transferase